MVLPEAAAAGSSVRPLPMRQRLGSRKVAAAVVAVAWIVAAQWMVRFSLLETTRPKQG